MTNTDNKRGTSSLSIWTALIAVYIVWGSTYLAIRFAVESLPPFLMASARFVFAGAILYAWRRASGDAAPSKVEWRSAAIVGLLLLAGGNGGVVWAEQRVVSGVAALLVGTTPLWMVLIDALRPGGQWPGWRAIAGVLMGFGGIAILVGPSEFAGNGSKIDLIGIAALIVAAFLWSMGSIYSRAAKLPSSPLLGTGMEMLMGGAGLLVLGTLTGEWGHLHLAAVSARSLLGVAYLIVFGSWVGFTAYTWLLRVAPTPLVSTYAYVNPVVALVLGFLLANERLSSNVLIAAAVILGAVVMVKTVSSPRPEPEAAPELAPVEDDC